jgi:hypothetical protein
MRRLLLAVFRAFWDDWAYAPISGTMVLALIVTAWICLYRGEVDRTLLLLIFAQVIMTDRRPLRKDD